MSGGARSPSLAVEEQDFDQVVKLSGELRLELDRLFVLTGDPQGEDAARGADQVRRALELAGQLEAGGPARASGGVVSDQHGDGTGGRP